MSQGNKKIAQSPFTFRNFIIAESQIKIGQNTKANSVDVDIEPSGCIYEEEKLFEINLKIKLSSDDGLSVYVELIGYFEFKEVINITELSSYFYVNAPAIIFPYLRSYISALTALSGCKTINLPPMNMMALGKKLEENTNNK